MTAEGGKRGASRARRLSFTTSSDDESGLGCVGRTDSEIAGSADQDAFLLHEYKLPYDLYKRKRLARLLSQLARVCTMEPLAHSRPVDRGYTLPHSHEA
jgi:hypothetical protein